MYPGDASFGVLVFDAVSGDGVVFHYLSCTASSLDVGLEEDYGLGFGDAYVVLQDEGVYCFGVEYCLEEGGELGVITGLYRAVYYGFGNCAYRFLLLMFAGFCPSVPFCPCVGQRDSLGQAVGMVVEVFFGCVVVGAAAFVVAAADSFVNGRAGFIDV